MAAVKSDFIHLSQERGFLHQATDLEALDTLMSKQSVVAYLGFDATATSLQVGNLVPLMWARLLQKCGHKPIILMGTATTRIGDPSGKDTQRQFLSEDAIGNNVAAILPQFKRYIQFGDRETDAIMVDNGQWLDPLSYLGFLRDYGRHFSINRMLSFESVKLRLDRQQPLSFLEFNYMLLQAYDFLELSRRHECMLQLGGGDQWGNIINGVDLVRRVQQKTVYGLTTPLMTTSGGQKMGKSAQGAVWVNEAMLSSYDYWQYWRNTDDRDVGRFLRIFTDVPLDEIARLEALKGSEINVAKEVLADETTRLAHGDAAVAAAKQTAYQAFSQQGNALEGLPQITITPQQLQAGLPVIDALVGVGLCASKGEARRLIKGKGGRVNDAPISSEDLSLIPEHVGEGNIIKLSAGKKKHAIVRVEG